MTFYLTLRLFFINMEIVKLFIIIRSGIYINNNAIILMQIWVKSWIIISHSVFYFVLASTTFFLFFLLL